MYYVTAVQAASKTLYDCINDVYESGWVGQEALCSQTQNIEMLWQDLSHKLADQVLLPLNSYYAQFPETKVYYYCYYFAIIVSLNRLYEMILIETKEAFFSNIMNLLKKKTLSLKLKWPKSCYLMDFLLIIYV